MTAPNETVTKELARALAERVGERFQLTFETIDGETFRVMASEDQANAFIDEIDDLVGDADADEPELTEEEQHVSEEQPS